MKKLSDSAIGIIMIAVVVLLSIGLLVTYQSINNKNVYQGSKTSTTVKIAVPLEPTDFQQVIYDSEEFTLAFDRKDFDESLRQYIMKHHIEDDIKLMEYIAQEAKKSNSINIRNVDKNLVDRVQYRIADLLSKSQFRMFDKKRNKYVDSITIEQYEYNCGPHCGNGGRQYSITETGEVFFEVVDWIS